MVRGYQPLGPYLTILTATGYDDKAPIPTPNKKIGGVYPTRSARGADLDAPRAPMSRSEREVALTQGTRAHCATADTPMTA